MSGPWCIETIFPVTDRQVIGSIWSSGPNDTLVVGDKPTSPDGSTSSGFIFHWNGCSWSQSPLPSPEPGLSGIWGAASDDVWAVGVSNGTALNWDGTYWSNVPIGANVGLSSVSGTGPDDVWATGGYHWNGSNWSLPGGPVVAGDVWAGGPNNVWGTAGQGNVVHWDGTAWTKMQAVKFPEFGLSAIWADATTAWAVGEGDQIVHFMNGAWTQVQDPTGSSEGFLDVMQDGADVWAVGQHTAHSVSGGPFVQDKDVPVELLLRGVWLTSTQVWAAGDNMVIHGAR
jgi:hypothetical protein